MTELKELPVCFLCKSLIFADVDADSFDRPVHKSLLSCVDNLRNKNTSLRAEIERLKAENKLYKEADAVRERENDPWEQ